MEELITLYYGNFVILGDRVRDFTWQTDCSNHIADRNCEESDLPWWVEEGTYWQEWGLFLLEHLLHYADSMWKKEHWRCSRRPQAEEAAPEHPSNEDPARCHWWHHYPSGRLSLSRRVDLGPQYAFLLSAWWMHEIIMAGVEQMYDQGWPMGSTKFDETLKE